ncbi:PilN domain-containing protein, partial [Oleiphilus sp. HI0079]|uniref:PilN domain-containing protein n=2 Tax=unclassified Oleiphilus TaxID=2631174 RepID=UPI000B2115C0
ISVWLSFEQADLDAQLENTRQSLSIQRDAKTSLEAKVAMLRLDDALLRQNKRLKQQIQARKALLETLDSVSVRDTQGFSSYMVGLARQTNQQLWLTRINVAESGASMALEGVAVSGKQVPAYLERLKQEPVFVGRNFTTFDLKQDEKNASRIHFQLQAVPKETVELIVSQRRGLPDATKLVEESRNER